MTISCGVAKDLHNAYKFDIIKVKNQFLKHKMKQTKCNFEIKKQFFKSMFLASKSDGLSVIIIILFKEMVHK